MELPTTGAQRPAGLWTYGRRFRVWAVCYHSELAELSRSTIVMVAGVYLLSIVIAIIFSYIAIWMVLKPIKKLQEDITCQNPEEVHFRESGIEEIDRIHQALNDMAAKAGAELFQVFLYPGISRGKGGQL